MTRIPTLREQIFGDFNKELNQNRAQVNIGIRSKCHEILEKKNRVQNDSYNRKIYK